MEMFQLIFLLQLSPQREPLCSSIFINLITNNVSGNPLTVGSIFSTTSISYQPSDNNLEDSFEYQVSDGVVVFLQVQVLVNLSPPGSTTSTKNSSVTIVAIVVPIVAASILAAIIFVAILKRKKPFESSTTKQYQSMCIIEHFYSHFKLNPPITESEWNPWNHLSIYTILKSRHL